MRLHPVRRISKQIKKSMRLISLLYVALCTLALPQICLPGELLLEPAQQLYTPLSSAKRHKGFEGVLG